MKLKGLNALMREKDFETKDLHAECREKQELSETIGKWGEKPPERGKGLNRSHTPEMYMCWVRSAIRELTITLQMTNVSTLTQASNDGGRALRLTGEAASGTPWL